MESKKHSFDVVIPNNTTMSKIAYEKTETLISKGKYDADFYFINPQNIVTKSDRSEKPTTIEISLQVYATTLHITRSTADLQHYLSALFEQHEQIETPYWMEDVSFGDDEKQNEIISVCEKEIEDANAKILAAQTKLKENSEIKSILYTNGNQLVSVVFKILEKILLCDLSKFIDEKREDFLIKNQNCTYIGEIKGVTTNARFEHISQLELHYRKYLDHLAESGLTENVKQLLIINPFRTKPLTQREPICSAQVELAVRNGCLIIETNTLLRIYERFCNNEVNSQKCVDVLMSKTGLLCLADFDNDTESNESH